MILLDQSRKEVLRDLIVGAQVMVMRIDGRGLGAQSDGQCLRVGLRCEGHRRGSRRKHKGFANLQVSDSSLN